MKSMNMAHGMALPAAGIAPVIFAWGIMQNANLHASGNHTIRAKCCKYKPTRAGTCQAKQSSTAWLGFVQRQIIGLKEIEKEQI